MIRDEHYVQETAQQYQQRYGEMDSAAIEVALAIHISHAAATEARTRLVHSFGLGRTGGRYSVLRSLYLADADYLTPNELATRLTITPASVTFLVDGLEKDGLVTRKVSQRDRRSRHIQLTEKGRTVCAELVPAVGALHGRLCAGFTDQEKRTFADMLMRFWSNAAAELETERPHAARDARAG